MLIVATQRACIGYVTQLTLILLDAMIGPIMIQVRACGGTAEAPGRVSKTRLEWALDDGHYPPWRPDEPKNIFLPKFEVTPLSSSPRHDLERSGQTPEKPKWNHAEGATDGSVRTATNLQLPPGVAGNMSTV